jgi:superfamily II DNA or RNA helicase
MGVGKLNRYRNQLLVHMPYDRHTKHHTHHIHVDYDKELHTRVVKDRWNVFENRPIRNVSEFFHTMRRVVYSHPSRLAAVRDVIKKHPKLIVFYNFDYELEILRTLSSEVTVAEWNGKKHDPIPDSDRWLYLVQYTAGSEGWNCIETDATLFYSLTYSYKAWRQAHGRIDRLNTPFSDLHYYVLLAKSAIDPAVMASLNDKKSFNEVRFAGKLRVSKV